MGEAPLNLSFLLALLCCLGVWLFIWHTRWGYEIRAVATTSGRRHYAGISATGRSSCPWAISGRARRAGRHQHIMGVHHRLIWMSPTASASVGIAGGADERNHPIGIIAAALLFGALYQGGSELASTSDHHREMS